MGTQTGPPWRAVSHTCHAKTAKRNGSKGKNLRQTGCMRSLTTEEDIETKAGRTLRERLALLPAAPVADRVLRRLDDGRRAVEGPDDVRHRARRLLRCLGAAAPRRSRGARPRATLCRVSPSRPNAAENLPPAAEPQGDEPAGFDFEGFLAEVDELRATVPAEEWDKVPADLAENLDHYLYGSPKR